MFSNIARVSLRNNNDLSHRLLRCATPPFSAGTPRGFLTYCGLPYPTFDDCVNGGNDVDTYSHPSVFQERYGAAPPLALAADERMLKKQNKNKQISVGTGREDEEDEQKQSNTKEDDEALYFKMDMPGVGKEDAKVYVDGNTLMVKGIRKLDSQFEDAEDSKEKTKCSSSNKKTYVAGVDIWPMRKYKMSEIKAEMKDGVLKVTVPKIKVEERTDVLHVKID